MSAIHVFTRSAAPHNPKGLAHAVHITVTHNGFDFPLNHGHGMLYATATIDEKNRIVPRYLQNARIGSIANGYVINADVVDEDGKIVGQTAWCTMDLITFTPCRPGEAPHRSVPDIQHAAEKAIPYWYMQSVSATVPGVVHLKDIGSARATVTYTDGSTHLKPVDWDLSQVDVTKPGRYAISGMVKQRSFDFPLLRDTGDPVLINWNGKWHFISTNDANGNIGLHMRRADTIEGLFGEDCEKRVILDYDEERGLVQTFWAPEFHCIGGRLCLLFAVGGKVWGPQCQVMMLKENGDPFTAEGWESPMPVKREDGRALNPGQITLDMTYIHASSGDYYVWSTRYDCMGPNDSGSMLCIARVDPKDPAHIIGEPVLISRPLLGFENVAGTINNEGPYALVVNDTVHLTYSGGDAAGYTYVIGELTADAHADLTDPASWTKEQVPLMHWRSVDGVFGPGHHSFFRADDSIYIAHHAETDLNSRTRCTGIHRVHVDKHGRLHLDMSIDRDLAPHLAPVKTVLVVD